MFLSQERFFLFFPLKIDYKFPPQVRWFALAQSRRRNRGWRRASTRASSRSLASSQSLRSSRFRIWWGFGSLKELSSFINFPVHLSLNYLRFYQSDSSSIELTRYPIRNSLSKMSYRSSDLPIFDCWIFYFIKALTSHWSHLLRS